jgi:CheY-like chemotaxis protein
MGKRILVADDSLTIQKAFAMVLDGSGYSLSFARSVDEALVVAKRDGRPDLVLADVALGNGSGYDLCSELKADSGLRDVPVFILASTQSPYDEPRGRKVGADGYLAKPFESQGLLDAVASVLSSPTGTSASAMPDFSDHNDNTARISAGDMPSDDDDSYGEITIERGPAPTSAASAWPAKTPTRPSGARPIPAAAPTPPPTPPAARPSLIPGARPSGSMPVARTGTTPQPSLPVPPPSAARPPMARTMMGFPSVKPPVAGGKAQPPAPPIPPRPAPTPVAAASVRSPMSMAPTPPAPMVSTPVAPAAPVMARAPGLAAVPPAVPTGTRPVVPRFSSPSTSADSLLSAPVTRKVSTPLPSAAFSAAAGGTGPSPAMAAAVSSVVDQKVAALAARGPEYEAIAKLSREIIEQVVWEVVPELAEAIIRQEIDRLASAKK